MSFQKPLYKPFLMYESNTPKNSTKKTKMQQSNPPKPATQNKKTTPPPVLIKLKTKPSICRAFETKPHIDLAAVRRIGGEVQRHVWGNEAMADGLR